MNLTRRESELLRLAECKRKVVGFELTFAQIRALPVTTNCPESERDGS